MHVSFVKCWKKTHSLHWAFGWFISWWCHQQVFSFQHRYMWKSNSDLFHCLISNLGLSSWFRLKTTHQQSSLRHGIPTLVCYPTLNKFGAETTNWLQAKNMDFSHWQKWPQKGGWSSAESASRWSNFKFSTIICNISKLQSKPENRAVRVALFLDHGLSYMIRW